MYTLLVSSDSQYKEQFERILRSRGHRVLSCHNLEAAWYVYVTQNPALILVAGGDDEVFEFCRRIQNEESGRPVTVAVAAQASIYHRVPDDIIVFPMEGPHNIRSGIAAAEQQAFQLPGNSVES